MDNSRYKFRAWDKTENKMLHNVGIHPHIAEAHDDGSFTLALSIERWDIMQYTGLKDKNVVEVFQKDILGGLLSGGYIDKCDKCYSFQYFLKDFGCMNCLGDVCWSEVVESILDGESWVIGNIYQHPELLNQAKG